MDPNRNGHIQPMTPLPLTLRHQAHLLRGTITSRLKRRNVRKSAHLTPITSRANRLIQVNMVNRHSSNSNNLRRVSEGYLTRSKVQLNSNNNSVWVVDTSREGIITKEDMGSKGTLNRGMVNSP